MISKESRIMINCKTEEEQNMILDIFEMLGMRWRAGESPRGYESILAPMYYCLDGNGRFAHDYPSSPIGISASEFRNQWISLKLKKDKEQANCYKVVVDDDWLAAI